MKFIMLFTLLIVGFSIHACESGQTEVCPPDAYCYCQ